DLAILRMLSRRISEHGHGAARVVVCEEIESGLRVRLHVALRACDAAGHGDQHGDEVLPKESSVFHGGCIVTAVMRPASLLSPHRSCRQSRSPRKARLWLSTTLPATTCAVYRTLVLLRRGPDAEAMAGLTPARVAAYAETPFM